MTQQPSPDELRRQLAALERFLADPAAAGMAEALLAPMRQQAEAVRQLLIGRGVQVEGDLDVGQDLVLGDKIEQQINYVLHIYRAPEGAGKLTDERVRRILSEYLRRVRDAHDQARLFGPESAPMARPMPRPGLTDVFIPLTLRRFNPPGRREREEALRGKAGLDILLAWRELYRAEGRVGEPVPLADLLTLSDRIAIVGGAGSGKSTVLAYLAATLAQAAQTGEPVPYRLPGKNLPVPLLIPLRYYRDYLDKCCADQGKQIDDPRRGTLAGFIPWYLQRRNPVLGLSEDFFDRLLLGGGCLLMLDGLDEVISRTQRGQVCQEVERLVQTIYPGNRVIVTAREAGYTDEAVFSERFTRLDVQALDETQIATLVENWCRHLYPANVAANRDALVGAIRYINDLRRERALPPLISTPLMTTMVVSVQWGETELPRERARLYEACVKAILQAQYVPDDSPGDPARARLVNWGGRWEEQRTWLSRLALAMHEGGRGAAAVRVERVREILGEFLAPDVVETFVRAVYDRGGLFEERGEFFQFLHLTFQEFLAARGLAKQRAQGWRMLAGHVTESWWREVMLLVYGYLQADEGPAAEYLDWLAHLDGDGHVRLAGAELAGAAVLELERPDPALRRRQAERLRELLEDEALVAPASLRATAGDVLGQLGDPRPGVATVTIGQVETPDILWVHVPAGAFIMGSPKEDDKAYSDERPAHTLTLPEFYIGRYPITNAQYGPFIAAGGYDDEAFWTPEGWAWRQGAEADLSPIDDKDFKKWYADWLKNRPRAQRNRPYWWDDAKWGKATRPVVGITWYEATAYCNWLQSCLAQAGAPFQVWPEARAKAVAWQGARVRLPSEAEWEKAARGAAGRRWPWGDAWQEDRANTAEAGLGETTAVGVFPAGASPYGVLDMAGNVWEWTCSRWGRRSIRTPDYGYPYRPDDGREESSGPDLRVVRGGAWPDNQRGARCAFRLRPEPDYFHSDLGFRVVLSLSASGF